MWSCLVWQVTAARFSVTHGRHCTHFSFGAGFSPGRMDRRDKCVVSAGMERLHPSWLAEVVACEPAELWPALLAGCPECRSWSRCWRPPPATRARAKRAGSGQGWLSVPKPPQGEPAGSPRDNLTVAVRSRKLARHGRPTQWLSCSAVFFLSWHRFVWHLRAPWERDCVAWAARSCCRGRPPGVLRFAKS